MKVEGTTTVSAMLDALGLTEDALPRSSQLEMGDEIDFSVAADEDKLAEEVEEEPQTLSEQLEQSDVVNLAAAIRRGDRAEAELMLDRLCADDVTASEWIAQGRFSRKAA